MSPDGRKPGFVGFDAAAKSAVSENKLATCRAGEPSDNFVPAAIRLSDRVKQSRHQANRSLGDGSVNHTEPIAWVFWFALIIESPPIQSELKAERFGSIGADCGLTAFPKPLSSQ